MIKIKLKQNRWNTPTFYLKVDEESKNHVLLKRALMESTKLKGEYNYKVPIRFFTPIYKNYHKDKITISEESLNNFLEFTDDFGEVYNASTVATALFMKKWREASCPNIYKIEICPISKEIKEGIAFKKISNLI